MAETASGKKEEKEISIEIVELSPDQWRSFQDLKLQSLEEEPIAFADKDLTSRKWKDREEKEWREILEGKISGGRLGESINLFAKHSDDLVGMVSAIILESEEYKVAKIQSMYVQKDFRGFGIGRKLLEDLLKRLREKEIIKAELNVVPTQEVAISLYDSLGFEKIKLKKQEARRGDQYYDLLQMGIEIENSQKFHH